MLNGSTFEISSSINFNTAKGHLILNFKSEVSNCNPVICLFSGEDFIDCTEFESVEGNKTYSHEFEFSSRSSGLSNYRIIVYIPGENQVCYAYKIDDSANCDSCTLREVTSSIDDKWLRFVERKVSDYLAIKAAIRDKKASWRAGLNRVVFLPDSIRLRMLGALPVPDSLLSSRAATLDLLDRSKELPDTLDWRNRFDHNWMTPIRNQGACGSCWAFGSVGAFEAAIKIGANEPDMDLDLSEETIVSDCYPEGSCNGGIWAGDYFVSPGIPDEECFPYSASNGPCNRCEDWFDRKFKLDSYVSIYNPTIEEMQTVVEHNPTYVSYNVYSDFSYYAGGVYEHLWGHYEAGHAVVCCGWNTTDSSWTIKNSWGDWGEDGYFRIKWGQCDIEMQAHFLYYTTPEDSCHDFDTYEPDDPCVTSRIIDILPVEQTEYHTIYPENDVDFLLFITGMGDTVQFWSTGYEDVEIELYDQDMTELITSDDNTWVGNNFRITFTPEISDTYLVKVNHTDTTETGCYTLHYIKTSTGSANPCGFVSGIWSIENSPYVVRCDVRVPTNQSLIIQPGVNVLFAGHYSIVIDSNAVFKAIGTEDDSIIFTCIDTHLTNTSGGWHGLRFYKASEACTLQYCRIEYGNADDVEFNYRDGGAIHCYYSDITIANNTIRKNRALSRGGGICCSESSPTIIGNLIENNIAHDRGGGIYNWHSYPLIKGNIIINNDADSNNASGGGIFCCKSSPNIIQNHIIGNHAKRFGGGLFAYWSSSPILQNNVIAGNHSEENGGGLYLIKANSDIINNTIFQNTADSTGGAIFLKGDLTSDIKNTIFYDNESPLTPDIHFDNKMDVSDVSISIDYSNIDSNRCFFPEGEVEPAWGAGLIYVNPLFRDADNNDFQLSEASPCKDAGDPNSNLDEDGSRNDMGAYGGMLKPEYYPENFIGGEYTEGTLTLSGSPYVVIDDLIIPAEYSLSVEPGVEVYFHFNAGIKAYGEFQAIGTEDDSIVFADYTGGGGFSGINLFNCDTTSKIIYCRIEGATSGDGGISCSNSSPKISHCNLLRNKRGIYCINSSPNITNCKIHHNSSYDDNGGGIFCQNSSPVISDNTISYNILWHHNSKGGGVFCESSNPVISCNMILGNETKGGASFGGGIYCNRSSPLIENNVIVENAAASGGGVALSWMTYPVMCNNTIARNSAFLKGGGLFCEFISSPIIVNSIMYYNHSEEGNEFYYGGYNNAYLDYCCVDSFGFEPAEENAFQWGGHIIIEPPQFADTAQAEYNLLMDSPCIDAGTGSLFVETAETLIYAPFVDIAGIERPLFESWDIGAFEFKIADEPPINNYSIKIYPNPFNRATTIYYQLAQAGKVKIEIFDLLGMKVATLVDSYHESGAYTKSFNSEDLSTGIYFCRIQHEYFTKEQKLVILK
ncbi:T9SS type A sorting domain-containing protein [bacterium]|nr:T9SS type A sorting domain-containing protein [bacterium]